MRKCKMALMSRNEMPHKGHVIQPHSNSAHSREETPTEHRCGTGRSDAGINAMIPGRRILAVFGQCGIKDFGLVTEVGALAIFTVPKAVRQRIRDGFVAKNRVPYVQGAQPLLLVLFSCRPGIWTADEFKRFNLLVNTWLFPYSWVSWALLPWFGCAGIETSDFVQKQCWTTSGTLFPAFDDVRTGRGPHGRIDDLREPGRRDRPRSAILLAGCTASVGHRLEYCTFS